MIQRRNTGISCKGDTVQKYRDILAKVIQCRNKWIFTGFNLLSRGRFSFSPMFFFFQFSEINEASNFETRRRKSKFSRWNFKGPEKQRKEGVRRQTWWSQQKELGDKLPEATEGVRRQTSWSQQKELGDKLPEATEGVRRQTSWSQQNELGDRLPEATEGVRRLTSWSQRRS